jgi:hypothetical protein
LANFGQLRVILADFILVDLADFGRFWPVLDDLADFGV